MLLPESTNKNAANTRRPRMTDTSNVCSEDAERLTTVRHRFLMDGATEVASDRCTQELPHEFTELCHSAAAFVKPAQDGMLTYRA